MAQETSVVLDVEKYLSGVNYPANKQAIIQYVKSRGANSDILSALNGISNREYKNSEDVLSELDM